MQMLQKFEFESIFAVEQQSDDVNDGNESNERQCLVSLQRIFNKIYHTIELMNATFKWSMSLNISIDIFTVAMIVFGHLQWFLDPKYENGTIMNFCGFVTYTSYYVYRLALLIGTSNSIVESAHLVATKIHEISLSRIVTDELKDMVCKIVVSTRDHRINK